MISLYYLNFHSHFHFYFDYYDENIIIIIMIDDQFPYCYFMNFIDLRYILIDFN
jgi:hypothetical protein